MSGMTYREVGAMFEISHERVRQILKAHGVDLKAIRASRFDAAATAREGRDALRLRTRRSIGERFMRKVSKEPNGCWLWTASTSPAGYGRFVWNDAPGYAPRFSYEYFTGKKLVAGEIDHLCMVRKCVNPDHLQVVTHQENVLRGKVAVHKEFCKRGHPRSGANLYVSPSGGRMCRECMKLYRKAS